MKTGLRIMQSARMLCQETHESVLRPCDEHLLQMRRLLDLALEDTDLSGAVSADTSIYVRVLEADRRLGVR